MSDQIYRVHRGIQLTASASTGRTEYFTSLSELARNLLRWKLESERASRRRYETPGFFAEIWLSFREMLGWERPTQEPETYPHTIEITSVQRHTSSGWVDLLWHYYPPSVSIDGDVIE